MEERRAWTTDEIRREEVRGVFAIGAMAALIALRFTPVAQKPIEMPSLFEVIVRSFGFGFPQLPVLTLADLADVTLPYWLGYVSTVCVALVDDFIPRNRVIQMLAYIAKVASRLFYALAVLATCLYGVLVFWKAAVFRVLLWIVIFAVLFGVLTYLRPRRRLKQA